MRESHLSQPQKLEESVKSRFEAEGRGQQTAKIREDRKKLIMGEKGLKIVLRAKGRLENTIQNRGHTHQTRKEIGEDSEN